MKTRRGIKMKANHLSARCFLFTIIILCFFVKAEGNSRSVKLNNYNNWNFGDWSNTPQQLNDQLGVLGRFDRICFTEEFDKKNSIPGWKNVTPQSLKAINPSALVYRLYDLNAKTDFDSDWPTLNGFASAQSTGTSIWGSFAVREAEPWNYKFVWLVNGSGGGQVKRIGSVNATTIVLAIGESFNPSPDDSTFFEVFRENPSSPSTANTPLSFYSIEANEWWLRSPEGNKYSELGSPIEGHIWYLDVGKPGFKEAFLQNILERNNGKGFDGIVFDYWWPELSWICRNQANPKQVNWPQGYSSDDEWFNNAWKPFIEYVMDGLHSAGYAVIGNTGAETDATNPKQVFERSKLQGIVYETWAIGWHGEWLGGGTVESKINNFRDEPLEAWTADYYVREPDYGRKFALSLAMYYIALPNDPTAREKRFYHHYKDSSVFWEPLWDFNIGEPAEPYTQLKYSNGTKRFVWSRKFTNGLVLLNYESSTENIPYSLESNYVDYQNNLFSGIISLPARTALILQRIPSTTTTSTTASTTTETQQTTTTPQQTTTSIQSTTTQAQTTTTLPQTSSTTGECIPGELKCVESGAGNYLFKCVAEKWVKEKECRAGCTKLGLGGECKPETNETLVNTFKKVLAEVDTLLADAKAAGLNVSTEEGDLRQAN
ncbi:hypothetical protein HY991_00090, partial [Candidatus Micrarchaeota archaeon]|nr:hypothetical protein [Candidatus Micrarchaeota archaeon]